MIKIIARITVVSVRQFRRVYHTRERLAQQKHGCIQAWLCPTSVRDRLTLFSQWESSEQWECYLEDSLSKTIVGSGGILTPPEFIFGEQPAGIPRWMTL